MLSTSHTMARGEANSRYSKFIILLTTAIVIAVLYFAKDFLIPIALSVLFCFLLAPLVRRLERLGLNRVGSVILTVSASLALVVVITWTVAGQLFDLAQRMPEYGQNIDHKIDRLRAKFNGMGKGLDFVEKQANRFAETSQPSTQSTQAAGKAPLGGEDINHADAQRIVGNLAGKPSDKPIPVTVTPPAPSPIAYLKSNVMPVLDPLGTAGMVVVFVIFMLLQKEDLRDRMLRLIGGGQLTVTTQAVDDAATRISRYLLMQLIVNVTYGIPIGVGLWFIGVPNAFLWGLLATILRFIPYIGPWIAAAGPILLSVIVFYDWRHFAMTLGLYVFVELISNNVVEPWLYGSSTGMSATAILVSAVFWTWLWGPMGLLLSTPLTVCVVVMGKYVPQLRFLDILLGETPALEPYTRVYQRLLAGDQEEATDVVEEYLEEKSLIEVYDTVLIPALALAHKDRHEGRLDHDRHQFIRQGVREMVEDLGERYNLPETVVGKVAPELEEASHVVAPPEGETPPVAVLCLPARDESDEISAMMLSQLLEKRGCGAKFVPVAALASEMVQTVADYKAGIVVVSALPPAASAHARYLCMRLRGKLKDVQLMVGLWTLKSEVSKKVRDRIRCKDSDRVVTRLSDALEQILPIATATGVANVISDDEAKEEVPGEGSVLKEGKTGSSMPGENGAAKNSLKGERTGTNRS